MRMCHVVLLLVLVPATAALGQKTLSYADLLGQLHDFDRLVLPQTGIEAGQFSSFHRDEYTSWGINADAGNYVREEPNGEVVMMEADGPGCIFRTWSANPMGTIRIYLDGATTPTYEFEFVKLFDGSVDPFVKPLCWRRGEDVNQASDCYLPIPFAKHIKITQDQRRGQFYIFDYLKYPADWQVPTFRLPLVDEERRALEAACAAWSAAGADPKPRLAGQSVIEKTVTIQPGETVTLLDDPRPGQVRAVRVKAQSAQRNYWRKLVLQANWDGADWPQVLSPLGPFFGFDWQTAEYRSLPAGCIDGEGYFYYPMPYRERARMTLRSYLELPATVTYRIETAPGLPPAEAHYFYARWRTEKDSTTFDYPFIETAGRGHLVGVGLQIDHPIPGWWGEGDEKVWIDDDTFPRWIGTGSEDYFGDAWGIRYLPGQSWGCSFDEHPKTCPYRWHFMDLIPFAKRLRMTIENYGCWFDFRHEHEYNSVAYWYQAEKTPPFSQLREARYTGGDYQDVPRSIAYDPNVFRPIRAGDLLCHGLEVPEAVEMETVLGGAGGRLITDAKLPFEFSLEQAVVFERVADGAYLGVFELTVPESIVYYPTIYTAPLEGLADVTVRLDGEDLEIIGRPAPGRLELSGRFLVAGRHEVLLKSVGAGKVIVDCLAMQPAQRADGVMEAEAMRVVSSQGCRVVRAEIRGFSSGRAIAAIADAPGGSVVLQLDEVPAKQYVLGVRAATGSYGVQFQAYVGGRAIGPVFDSYSPGGDGPKPMSSILPLGMIPAGTEELELRIVGRNPASQGWHLGLDYFAWQPLIIHPESAAGIWAEVAAVRGCEYRIQDLGGEHVGGHHLWIQPSTHNATVDLAIHVPEEGDYRLETRLTTSWDYAIVQPILDEKPLGQPIDTYTETVLLTPPIDLGTVHLTAGVHLLRFAAVDKNAGSQGYLMGIDYVKLTR